MGEAPKSILRLDLAPPAACAALTAAVDMGEDRNFAAVVLVPGEREEFEAFWLGVGEGGAPGVMAWLVALSRISLRSVRHAAVLAGLRTVEGGVGIHR